ncbi:MAG: twin-arginine translocase subunit TatC [Planctomycetota bacterium]
MSTPDPDLAVMSFGDHLEELRNRILRSLGVALLGLIVALIFQDRLVELITAPHRQAMQAILVERGIDHSIRELGELEAAVREIPSEEVVALLRLVERDVATAARIQELQAELASVRDPAARTIIEFLLAGQDQLRVVSGEQSAVRRFERRVAEVRALELRLREDATLFGSASFEEFGTALDQVEGVVAEWRTSAMEPGEFSATGVAAAGTWGQMELQTEKVAEVRDRLEKLADPEGSAGKLHTFSYPESFFSYLKICALVGVLLGLPWITIEMWRFVAAGLYPKERRAVTPFLPLSLVSLAAGGTFAYTVLVPVGLTYLGGYGSGDVLEPTFRLKDYVSLVVTLILGMGVVFQLPLVMVFGARAGFANADIYRRYRKFSILGALLLGSFLTPPDVVTQLLMAGPLVLLYESGILASQFLARRDAKGQNSDEADVTVP